MSSLKSPLQSLYFSSAKPFHINTRTPALWRLLTTSCACSNPTPAENAHSDDFREPFPGLPDNFSGHTIEDTVALDPGKLRVDSSISSRIPDLEHLISRSSTASPTQVRQIHAQILRTGLCQFPYYRTKLLSLYANHRCFSDAKNILSFEPDIISFTTLINASSKFNDFDNILSVFSRMLKHGLFPDAHVLPSVIKACAGLLAVKIGKQVHGFSLASGISLDSFVQSSLVHFYVKCDELVDAHKLFDNMVERDVVSWSALAAGYARKGDAVNARKVFNEVKNLGFQPNTVSWNGMIAGFNRSGCFLDAVLMFQQMHKHGFKSDGTSISSVLPAIGDLGYLSSGTQVHGDVTSA
ncbi:PREDICTED: pentatricopeptide repeat-containing protein At1g20230-like [Erythranthe guttata]|uniref:pentatricopeptide repeat-containing protein At1g20230-like n=1 Tax=Erythranthe guttata TaxID=4155 RepID=UPI00064E03CC|nr:PREDICTED: pentatricopeptide repeat-containing protein At1g20230-like [Erythranthe guttata]|eukprot:XP_012840361.1 PREDICTED: pentatricopeptide repeat-containing protein At1g20230-like [Erythranthe guttata]